MSQADRAALPSANPLNPLPESADSSPSVASTGQAAAPDHSILRAFSVLRYPDYSNLWVGNLFSSAGQWIQQVTIGWLTYELTGSAFLLGAVNGFRSVPLLFLAPFGGVAADRFDRKKLMLSTQIYLMVLAAIFAAVVATGNAHIWNIILFTLLTGVAWAFNMPVRQSVVPNLVPRESLTQAVALNSAGFNITRIIGPSIGGLLIAGVGTAGNFGLQALMYVGVAAMIWRVRIPSAKRASKVVSVWRNLAEGGTYVWHHPTLRSQMALALIPTVIALPYGSLMPIFAKDVLGVGPEGYGILMSAPGIGALVGTLTIATLGSIKRKGRLLFVSLVGLGATLVLFAQSGDFLLSLPLLALAGGFQMTYMATNQTLLQMSTPDEYRGRVMGIYMLNQGLLPLGSLMAGGLASLWSAPVAVTLMGASVLALTILAFITLPAMRKV